jgi:hypothetical protein
MRNKTTEPVKIERKVSVIPFQKITPEYLAV